MSSSGFPFLSAKAMTIAGIEDVVVLRVSFTGECGYEMYLPGNRHPALFEAILREGARLGLGLVGTRSLMHTRLEKSFPTWGLEISPDYTALDCNLMTHVRPDKGTFIGRDAVLAYGSRKERFATFTVDAGDCAVWGGEAVFLEGETVGYVSSGGWGPHVEAHVALGYVAPDAYREGGDYAVEVLGQLRAARLHGLPLYDPDGTRMRA